MFLHMNARYPSIPAMVACDSAAIKLAIRGARKNAVALHVTRSCVSHFYGRVRRHRRFGLRRPRPGFARAAREFPPRPRWDDGGPSDPRRAAWGFGWAS